MVKGTTVTLIPVADRASHWEVLDAADAIVFGCPTYMGSGSAALKAFILDAQETAAAYARNYGGTVKEVRKAQRVNAAFQQVLDHPGAGDVAQGDRPAEAEAGRGEAAGLQAVVAHALVPRLDVGPQPGHVHGHLGAGEGAAGDRDGAAHRGGAADDVVGGRDRPEPFADPVADEAVGVGGHHPLAVGPAACSGAAAGP
jgi:hypothetical protein